MLEPTVETENLLHRVRELEIALLAQQHRVEIMQLASQAPDSAAFIASIAGLLQISEGYARMVKLMSIEKLASRYSRQRTVEELEELRLILKGTDS